MPASALDLARLVAAHPGMYPRNPVGKGYAVIREPFADAELPLLEDPTDLLTPERLIDESPEEWWQMPCPCTLGFREVAMFPRLLPMGCAPWFDPPEDERLEEVRRSTLPAGYRSHSERLGYDVFASSAPFGQSFSHLAPGTPISVTGVREGDAVVELRTPPPPEMTFELDGALLPAASRSSRYVVHTEERRLDVVYHLEAPLGRGFIRGVHKYLALQLRVEGVGSTWFAPPPTFHDAVIAGRVDREAEE
jgi:hypothetical protein